MYDIHMLTKLKYLYMDYNLLTQSAFLHSSLCVTMVRRKTHTAAFKQHDNTP